MADGEWQRVQVPGGASVTIPPGLLPDDVHGMDSAIQVWSGEGVEVLVDTGPMSDRLERHEGKEEVIAGHDARVVDFADAGTHVHAAHFEDPAMTVTVRTSRPTDTGVAEAIIAGVTFSDQGAGHGQEAAGDEPAGGG